MAPKVDANDGEGEMERVPLRLDDDLYEKLKERAGNRGMNAFVVDLIKVAMGLHEALEGSPDGVMVTEELVVDAKPLTPTIRRGGPALVSAAELLEAQKNQAVLKEYLGPADLAGYCCGFQTRSGQCSKPATHWASGQARCAEH
jgi:hypothetical protein